MNALIKNSLIFIGLLMAGPVMALPPLQLFVDLTPLGKTLRLIPGSYSGPVVINKPIVIEGGGEVTVDNEGVGTVMTIMSDHVAVRGLHLTGSGTSHNAMDAGVLIEANEVIFEDNRLDDVLFGIHIKQGNANTIRNNTVTSKPFEPSLRGEGLRIWYGNENLIEGNAFYYVRDLLLTNSSANEIIGNELHHNRISLEFIFSPDNLIKNNHIGENDTGIVAIYSDGLLIEGNHIEHIRNTGSSALAIKESSQVRIKDNNILHNAVGLTANSPVFPENILYLENNHFSYNNVAMYFYGEKGGHIIHGNRFVNNLSTIAVSHVKSAKSNDWDGNLWDDYQGFDRDHDGYGDTPHTIKLYADRIWMDRPVTQFFRGTPIMGMIDFMERLAPFSQPGSILTDPRPLVD
ncbi:MAG: nitrous oxide reductase family maturation protein NosD [Candidatus Thiodiazotropha sp. (ex. Lucinisca nassula)]|nr:nitrous oxide reductase family maturation protein NosD [Candidatus Thiodiazotropha sp. (ex. Lucinisca nassula)]PUB80593.1 MAG: nitrous oxide reductase family maturation protein NosD [gamma proteobacterium symbiont of Ctena orbiculata]